VSPYPRVLVDARLTQEGYKDGKHRGLGHYASRLLQELPALSGPGTLSYLVDSGKPVDPWLAGLGVPLCGTKSSNARSVALQIVDSQRFLPDVLSRSGCDLVHFLLHLDAPLFSPIPSVLTVPDLIPRAMKQIYDWERRAKLQVLFRLETALARRAASIIAISEHTKKDIELHLGIDPARVKVIPLGVQEEFLRNIGGEEIERVRSRYALPERFILYVGGIDPRKNIPALVEAWGALFRDSRYRIPLVLAGRLSHQREYPALLRQIHALGLEGNLIMPGYIPDEDLPVLLAAATVFAFPSLYEGFGLPVLQAMAAGCPVLTTRFSSIPEVAGNAAWYVAGGSAGEIAEGLRSLFDHPEEVRRLCREGRYRASQFSWKETARQTMMLYQETAEKSAMRTRR
jgi:glycosyltransferase involved in cell wall biosynthesis